MYPLLCGLITTFRCPLQCDHCCFRCGPSRTENLNLSVASRLIDTLAEHSDTRCVAFTGGEPFLYEGLGQLVGQAEARRLSTRVVTSAFWGRSEGKAREVLGPLVEHGLRELNISTGDLHAEHVPLERVYNAAVVSANSGIRTLVVVERHDRATITKELVTTELKRRLGSHRPRHAVVVIENVIVPMRDAPCGIRARTAVDSRSLAHGCNNVLLNMSVLPTGEVYACCGLTMTQIPELAMGRAEDLIAVRTRRQVEEFLMGNLLWLWLATEGPERLARRVENEIGFPIMDDGMLHRCHICRALFSNGLSRAILAEQARGLRDRILLEFFQSQSLFSEVLS